MRRDRRARGAGRGNRNERKGDSNAKGTREKRTFERTEEIQGQKRTRRKDARKGIKIRAKCQSEHFGWKKAPLASGREGEARPPAKGGGKGRQAAGIQRQKEKGRKGPSEGSKCAKCQSEKNG